MVSSQITNITWHRVSPGSPAPTTYVIGTENMIALPGAFHVTQPYLPSASVSVLAKQALHPVLLSPQDKAPFRQLCWGSIALHVTLWESECPPHIGGFTMLEPVSAPASQRNLMNVAQLCPWLVLYRTTGNGHNSELESSIFLFFFFTSRCGEKQHES